MKVRQGFVMVAALWIVVLCVGLSTEIAFRMRMERQLAIALIEEVDARNAAHAGIERVKGQLAALAAAAETGSDTELVRDPWHSASRLGGEVVQHGGASYKISVRPSEALLNINEAEQAELARFFTALGAEPAIAASAAAAVMDWIDSDYIVRPGGAERESYGPHVQPANAPMNGVHELALVSGVTAELFAAAIPHITVTGSGRVHLGAAPAPVLHTLPGMSSVAVEQALRKQREGTLRSAADLLEGLPPDAHSALEAELPRIAARTTLVTSEVVVMSEGTAASGRSVTIEALFIRSGGRVHTSSWRIR